MTISSTTSLQKPSSLAPFFAFASYLLILCCLSFLVYPVADDYTYALKIKNTPFWEYYKEFYLTWSGRFMSNFMLPILGAQSNNLSVYQILPILLIANFLLSTYFFFKNFFQCTQQTALLLAIAFSATYFSGYVSMAQGVYWMAGGFTYQIAFNSLVFLLGAIAIFAKKQHASALLHIVSAISVAIATGCNEVTMFSTVTIFTIAAIVAQLHNHPRRNIFAIYAVLAIAFACLATFAPGNFARIDNDTDRPSFLFWLGFVSFRALGGGFEAFKWLALSPFFLFMAAAIPFLKTSFQGKLIPSWSTKQNAMLAFALIWTTFFWDYFISIWSSGKHPYARVNNAIYTDVFFACLLFYTVYLAPVVSPKIRNFLQNNHSKLCWALLAGVLLMPNSLNIARNSFNGDFAAHYSAVSKQYQAAAVNQGKQITVPSSSAEPRPIFFRHLDDPRKKWILSAFQNYWDLQSITFKPSAANE